MKVETSPPILNPFEENDFKVEVPCLSPIQIDTKLTLHNFINNYVFHKWVAKYGEDMAHFRNQMFFVNQLSKIASELEHSPALTINDYINAVNLILIQNSIL